jgi:hypothetical protein
MFPLPQLRAWSRTASKPHSPSAPSGSPLSALARPHQPGFFFGAVYPRLRRTMRCWSRSRNQGATPRRAGKV